MPGLAGSLPFILVDNFPFSSSWAWRVSPSFLPRPGMIRVLVLSLSFSNIRDQLGCFCSGEAESFACGLICGSESAPKMELSWTDTVGGGGEGWNGGVPFFIVVVVVVVRQECCVSIPTNQ